MDCPSEIPVFEDTGKQQDFINLKKHFELKYGGLPQFYVRVPGRVNLIGEHIDYCGFSVLPMAIEQDIMLAVSCNSDKMLKLSNLDSENYADYFTSVHSINIDQAQPKWYHYFLCGYKGITEDCLLPPKGLNALVKGTIPPSSGLSSSSALVCAAALATAYANRVMLNKITIASLCAKCERYIGTEGGGMDQAICFLAEQGSAKLIEFNPLKATDVPLPSNATFIVTNSCVEMNKAASSTFNIRVVECKLAAKILAKGFQLEWQKVEKLADIPERLQIPLSDMASAVKRLLHDEPYTASEICQVLKIGENEFQSCYLTKNTNELKIFKLYQRALHVYEEAVRVDKFREVCCKKADDTLEELGRLMNESHASCRDLYECSHPILDELVQVASEAGALGSRLTGAGWGGCSVSLVTNENVESFMKAMENNFYDKTSERKGKLKLSMFPTQPGNGASTYIV